jgi:hypothetical protein
MDQMTMTEALRYFGLPLTTEGRDRLEELIVDNDMDISLDEDGHIGSIATTNVKEVLFTEHLKKVGHRPDSPKEMKRAKEEKERKDKEEKDKMEKDKEKLKMKVQAKKLKEH